MFIELSVAILIFSVVPVVVKFTSANPYTIGFFRLIVASILLSAYWNKKINWRAYRERTFWKLVIIGLCFLGHWITYTFSVKIGGPSVCVLGMATYGVQLIFYGSIFLGYHVLPKNILCLALILFGVALVIPSWDYHNETTLGLLLALLSASFYAVIPIMLQKSHEFNQETRIFFQFGLALVGYVLLLPMTEWESLSMADWSSLFFLAVLGTFVAHTLWSRCISRLPTTTTGIVYYLITPLAMILSAAFLHERLSLMQQLGGAIILVAALINNINFTRFKKKFRAVG